MILVDKNSVTLIGCMKLHGFSTQKLCHTRWMHETAWFSTQKLCRTHWMHEIVWFEHTKNSLTLVEYMKLQGFNTQKHCHTRWMHEIAWI